MFVLILPFSFGDYHSLIETIRLLAGYYCEEIGFGFSKFCVKFLHDLYTHIVKPVKDKNKVRQGNAHKEEPAYALVFHIFIILSCDVKHSSINSDGRHLQ